MVCSESCLIRACYKGMVLEKQYYKLAGGRNGRAPEARESSRLCQAATTHMFILESD